jgi:UDP-N-acetylmuramate dehydrogenase
VILQENVPLSPLTTLQVGGPARYFVAAASSEDVREAVDFSRAHDWPLFILGGGSNLLVSDAGWPGLVLQVAIPGVERQGSGLGSGRFEVGAGEDWDGFVAQTVRENCAGLECLSGIPGTVGGTPIQNVGAYGQEVSAAIVSVHALDLASGSSVDIANAECNFHYRASIFNTAVEAGGAAGRYIVLRVTYQLTPGGAPRLGYADLKRSFESRGALSNSVPTLAETRQAVREIRGRKGMLVDPADPDSRSAGSFFKNPIVSLDLYQKLAEQYKIPHWWAGLNVVKLSAAWLVESAGFPKGFRRGQAGVSAKHALALTNLGGATAADIVALQAEIVAGVRERFGVSLQHEPMFVGDFTEGFRATDA